MLLQSLCFVVRTPCRTRNFWIPETSEKDIFFEKETQTFRNSGPRKKRISNSLYFFPLSPFIHWFKPCQRLP